MIDVADARLVWVLLGLIAIGFVLRLVEDKTGLDVAERFGRALAFLFILALLGVLMVGFKNMGWQ